MRRVALVSALMLALPVAGGSTMQQRASAALRRVPVRAGDTACGPSWQLHGSPEVPGSAGEYIADVDGSPGSFAFAVGRYWDSSGISWYPLAEQWDGTRWKLVRAPAGIDIGLEGVTAISDSDAWAVGEGTGMHGLSKARRMHWDGARWKGVTGPVGSNDRNYFLYDVDAVATDDVWAVGVSQPSVGEQINTTYIEHWDGLSWQIVSSPNFGTDANELVSVAALSPTDVWAVGRHYPFSLTSTSTLTEHWDGTEWSIVPSPDLQQYDALFGMDAISATDIWAVGAAGTQGGTVGVPLTLHWAGSTWDIVPAPKVPGMQSTGFTGVRAASADDVWAVGSSLAADQLSHNTAEHWDGTAWSIQSFPEVEGDSNGLVAITLTSSGRWWAAGGHDDPQQFDVTRAVLADLCPDLGGP